jgi:hypothetical protein
LVKEGFGFRILLELRSDCADAIEGERTDHDHDDGRDDRGDRGCAE